MRSISKLASTPSTSISRDSLWVRSLWRHMGERKRSREIALAAVATCGWAVYAYLSVWTITTGWRLVDPVAPQFDWHVYAAGARDLLDRSLYRDPLYLDGLALAAPRYNLPPLSALWALPLASLPVPVAGAVWQVLGAVSLAVAAVAALALSGSRHPFAVGGVVVGAYSLHHTYLDGVLGGTNNYLVLALVAGFAWQHLHGHDRSAGVLLALAVATKVWPITLVAVLLRERKLTTLAWCSLLLAVQGAAFVAWLGPDVLPAMLDGLRLEITPVPGAVLGLSALREETDWWPGWGAVVVSAALLALPVRGRAGVGVGVLAGLALIANLWTHYASTVAFGALLAIAPTAGWLYRQQRWRPGAHRPRPRDK